MNNSKKRNRLYNFIVNTYDLSRESIMEHANARIDDVLNKHLGKILESNNIKDMILRKVQDSITNGFKSGMYSQREPFADEIHKILREEVKKALEEKYSIDIKPKV